MRDVTICLAYYMNPAMLQVQYDNLDGLPAGLKPHLKVIVVDDGSPVGPAYPPPEPVGVEVSIYRMREDIPWNQDACRNLAVKQAETQWVLLTDMDHVPPPALLDRLVKDPALASDVVYRFRRVTAPDLTPYKPHPNSWFMTRAMYDRIGGYDERYRGVYGTDGMFEDRVITTARRLQELKEALVRYPREVIPDASTTTLVRRSPENEQRRRQLNAETRAMRIRWPVRGLTEWDRVC